MAVVSISNLVSSETYKIANACNFPNMALNSFVVLHDLMRGQIESYVNEGLPICSFMMAEL